MRRRRWIERAGEDDHAPVQRRRDGNNKGPGLSLRLELVEQRLYAHEAPQRRRRKIDGHKCYSIMEITGSTRAYQEESGLMNEKILRVEQDITWLPRPNEGQMVL